MKKSFIIILCLFVAGCSSSVPRHQDTAVKIPQLSAEQARLYFLRPQRPYLTQRAAPITIDDRLVGNCQNGRFFYIDVIPKALSISCRLWDLVGTSTLKITPQKGGTYYIQIGPRDEKPPAGILAEDPGTISGSGGAFSLHAIKKEVALRLLSELDYLPQ